MNSNLEAKELLGFSQYRVHFEEKYFTTSIVGTSDCNTFIPLYSIFSNQEILCNKGEIKILEYYLPLIKNVLNANNISNSYLFNTSIIDKYSDLIHKFQHISSSCFCQFLFKIQGTSYAINIQRGIIYDDQSNILMCIGINSEYALNNSLREIENNIDTTKFMIFISNKFNNPIYKNIRKKIDLEYLSKIKQLDIDIVETNRINDWLFKNNFKKPKFKSVIEMNKHMKEQIPMYLFEVF